MSSLKDADRCPNCLAWHGVPPLQHLSPDKPCEHIPTLPCVLCGQSVGALSMGGSKICSYCDNCQERKSDIND